MDIKLYRKQTVGEHLTTHFPPAEARAEAGPTYWLRLPQTLRALPSGPGAGGWGKGLWEESQDPGAITKQKPETFFIQHKSKP